MSNKWEARERNAKRIALIVSVVVHLIALVAISTSTGETNTFRNLLEQVFGGEEQQEQLVSETKV